jgi:hypothetical protein
MFQPGGCFRRRGRERKRRDPGKTLKSFINLPDPGPIGQAPAQSRSLPETSRPEPDFGLPPLHQDAAFPWPSLAPGWQPTVRPTPPPSAKWESVSGNQPRPARRRPAGPRRPGGGRGGQRSRRSGRGAGRGGSRERRGRVGGPPKPPLGNPPQRGQFCLFWNHALHCKGGIYLDDANWQHAMLDRQAFDPDNPSLVTLRQLASATNEGGEAEPKGGSKWTNRSPSLTP